MGLSAQFRIRPFLALVLLPLAGFSAEEPAASARRQGDALVIDLQMVVPAKLEVVWQVLTDYESMPSYMPNLSTSKVVRRGKGSFVVRQEGTASIGPFKIPYTSAREIRLTARKSMRAQSVEGTKPTIASTTTLKEEAGGVRVTYHATARELPALARLATSTFAKSARTQFAAMRAEMIKRNGTTS